MPWPEPVTLVGPHARLEPLSHAHLSGLTEAVNAILPSMVDASTTELGSPTWVPVVQSQPGWDRILLPTRPNRSTGWIYLSGGGLRIAHTAYRVEVSLSTYRLTILDAGRSLGTVCRDLLGQAAARGT